MREALFALLAELVAVPSTYPPGDTVPIARHCGRLLEKEGYAVSFPGKNVVARLGSGRPSVVFNAHADTVEVGERSAWRTDPFRATLVDGRVYGLGACNAKSAMAVHLWLAREIARRGGPRGGEVVFTFVGDEENLGTEGLAFLRASKAVRPDVLIVAAQTRNRLVLEERGVMWVRVATRGRAAHAGAPEGGDSAVLKMVRLIGDLRTALPERRSASGHRTTLSIGRIRGGENINVVPEQCVIELDRRILPGDDFREAFEELKRICEEAGASSVELLTGTPGFSAPENGAAVRAFSEAIQAVTGRPPQPLNVVGASDARYFARDGVEIVVTGPGDGADSHRPNEFVALDEVVESARIHLAAAERLFAL